MMNESVTASQQYFIRSNGLIHMPGFFRWIVEGVLPFDAESAMRILDSVGLPTDACVAVHDGSYVWHIEDDNSTVCLITYH
jgi:hypothetical protein